MSRKRILIVNDGGYRGSSAAKGSYDTLAEGFQQSLERLAERKNKEVPKHGPWDVITVEIVTITDVKQTLQHAGDLSGVYAVIFLTRGMLDEAKMLAQRYGDRITIVVLTGSRPKDEPIVLDKGWVTTSLLAGIVHLSDGQPPERTPDPKKAHFGILEFVHYVGGGTLTEERREAIQAHVEGSDCFDCKGIVEAMEEFKTALQREKSEAAP